MTQEDKEPRAVQANKEQVTKILHLLNNSIQNTPATNLDVLAACMTMVLKISIENGIPEKMIIHNLKIHWKTALEHYKKED